MGGQDQRDPNGAVWAIEVEGLAKRFGRQWALHGLDMRVPRGIICGLLGGNGAGKTTTLAILMGLLKPTSGKVSILGVDLLRDRFKALPRMNFTSPYVDLPRRLTVYQNLDLYARLYNVHPRKERILELAETLGLTEWLNKPYGFLSAGQKTRVALAKSLLNRPEVLLLDEPTASLDPDSADQIRRHLLDYQRETGATLLFASHNMQEVERLCDEVYILKAGRLFDHGSPKALIEKYGRENLEELLIAISRERSPGKGLDPAPGTVRKP